MKNFVLYFSQATGGRAQNIVRSGGHRLDGHKILNFQAGIKITPKIMYLYLLVTVILSAGKVLSLRRAQLSGDSLREFVFVHNSVDPP